MNKKVHSIAYCAAFSAMIFVLTAVLHIPVPSGYVHPGDALVYLCALMLGSPWALIAGAVGEGLADLASGYTAYIPATVLIKVAVALLMTFAKGNKLLSKKSAVLTIPAGLITVGGYFAADLIISPVYAFVDIIGNIVQAAGSAVIFVVLAAALDKAKIIDRIRLNN